MFRFFKKKQKEVKQAENYTALLSQKQIKIEEPMTIAKFRLEHGARDIGAEKALPMYNKHMVKISNQWINPLQSINSGYGTSQLSFYNYQNVDYYECYALAQDPILNKIYNVLSKTPFANGGEIPDLNDEEKEVLRKAVQRHKVYETIVKAVRSNYVCGGCLVYMDFGQDDLTQELNLKNVDMNKFKGFVHIDPINMSAIEVNTSEPAKEDYMNPKYWYVTGLGTVHKSHFLKFEDNVPELVMKPLCLYFGMPLTLLIKQDVANSNLASQGLANIINRFRMVYLKTSEENFIGQGVYNFKNRLEVMSLLQDNMSIYPIKDTEEVLQLTTSISGMAENCEFFYQLLSAKTDITLSILLGKGAQGLSGTLEGERKNFYDRIRSIQESNKNNLLTMLGIAYGKETDGKFKEFTDFLFNPLEQPNESERSENIRSYVEMAKSLVELGVANDKALDWLKGHKELGMQSLEIDTETAGLEDYDDIITQNADFKEADHPRDEDGKFTSGSGSVKERISKTPMPLTSKRQIKEHFGSGSFAKEMEKLGDEIKELERKYWKDEDEEAGKELLKKLDEWNEREKKHDEEKKAKTEKKKASADFNVVQETSKAFLIEKDGKRGWVQKKWVKDDGTLTEAGEKAMSEAESIEDIEKEEAEREKGLSLPEKKDYESDRAVGYKIKVNVDTGRYDQTTEEMTGGVKTVEHMMFIPKSLIKGGRVPTWFLEKKLGEIEQEYFSERAGTVTSSGSILNVLGKYTYIDRQGKTRIAFTEARKKHSQNEDIFDIGEELL